MSSNQNNIYTSISGAGTFLKVGGGAINRPRPIHPFLSVPFPPFPFPIPLMASYSEPNDFIFELQMLVGEL
jgi:hypothetical protein